MCFWSRARALLVVLPLLGCSSGSAAEDAARTEDAIYGGTADPSGYAAVGLVSSGGLCTGTLIAPDVVLTAAHCVTYPVRRFYTGDAAGEPKVAHRVKGQAQFPGFVPVSCPSEEALDIGLVLLEEPVSGVTPIAVTAAVPSESTTCVAVGFGVDDDGHVGHKRSATSTVDKILTKNLSVVRGPGPESGIAAGGDSGGPLLCGGVIAGVVSCHRDGRGDDHVREAYSRPDIARDWIAQKIAEWHPAPPR